MKTKIFTTAILLLLTSCADKEPDFDASGTFEAVETIVSSEAQGLIQQLDLELGEELTAGQRIGQIDSLPLYLQKRQLEAQRSALLGRRPNIPVQISVLEQQLRATAVEVDRLEKLVQGDAATPKELDGITSQYSLLKKQLQAQRSVLANTVEGIDGEGLSLQFKIEELELQLQKCTIINPVPGTVLAKYAEAHEMTAIGKPLYKIADLSVIFLRVYISGDQLAQVQLNQEVAVFNDDGQGEYREARGRVVWISDKAEFTPKSIQTREERANKVYAIRIKVENEGSYKIGM